MARHSCLPPSQLSPRRGAFTSEIAAYLYLRHQLQRTLSRLPFIPRLSRQCGLVHAATSPARSSVSLGAHTRDVFYLLSWSHTRDLRNRHPRPFLFRVYRSLLRGICGAWGLSNLMKLSVVVASRLGAEREPPCIGPSWCRPVYVNEGASTFTARTSKRGREGGGEWLRSDEPFVCACNFLRVRAGVVWLLLSRVLTPTLFPSVYVNFKVRSLRCCDFFPLRRTPGPVQRTELKAHMGEHRSCISRPRAVDSKTRQSTLEYKPPQVRICHYHLTEPSCQYLPLCNDVLRYLYSLPLPHRIIRTILVNLILSGYTQSRTRFY